MKHDDKVTVVIKLDWWWWWRLQHEHEISQKNNQIISIGVHIFSKQSDTMIMIDDDERNKTTRTVAVSPPNRCLIAQSVPKHEDYIHTHTHFLFRKHERVCVCINHCFWLKLKAHLLSQFWNFAIVLITNVHICAHTRAHTQWQDE